MIAFLLSELKKNPENTKSRLSIIVFLLWREGEVVVVVEEGGGPCSGELRYLFIISACQSNLFKVN